MNLTHRQTLCSVPLALAWTRAGLNYRLTPWPDVQVERRYGSEWVAIAPTPEDFVDAEPAPAAWRAFLEFVPADVRELVARFRTNRLLALWVAAHLPDLVGSLTEVPALVTFAACHPRLRGTTTHRWDELSAQFEWGGLFGVLDWLGLPATKSTVSILTTLIAADLSPRLAEGLRSALWRPTGLLATAANGPVTNRYLTDHCALAA